MIVGDRLRVIREEKKLSQGDIEKRTGRSVAMFLVRKRALPFQPSQTLEKFARALECYVRTFHMG